MTLQEAIKKLAMGGFEVYCKACCVDAVDEELRTIDCTPLDESAPLIGVNLQADQSQGVGFVQFPVVGSEVIVGFLSESVAVVLLAMEISKVILTIDKSEVVIESNNLLFTSEKISIGATSDAVNIDVDGTTIDLTKDSIVCNGGSETIANATELKKQLTTMSGRIDAIIDVINSAPVAPTDGGATFKAALISSLTPHKANKETFGGIIDDKIKH